MSTSLRGRKQQGNLISSQLIAVFQYFISRCFFVDFKRAQRTRWGNSIEQHTIHVPRDFPGLSSPTLLLEIGV